VEQDEHQEAAVGTKPLLDEAGREYHHQSVSLVAIDTVLILVYNSYHTLNLADNAISDYGMHAIKSIITNPRIKSLNLASNMISDSGIEMVLEEIAKSPGLRALDLGVLEGSIRKNALGVDGAKCIAAIILQNKQIDTLRLQDNDIGSTGGEIIGTAMKSNRTLRHLKISENDLKSQGAEYILKSATLLESLDLSKNFIKATIGPALRDYLEQNASLKRINLEYAHL
jgi:Ran GTPase-activating protein (RanGAP) involved in mRNA processing and transport